MEIKKIYKCGKSNVEICEAFMAQSFKDRLIGLMFSKAKKQGLLLYKTKSIHTSFMLFTLDVYFLDKNFKVIKVLCGLKPWRITGYYYNAVYVLEVPTGSFAPLICGDQLEVKHV
jgi:uncharacterized membrane protein (UPF0127 family)